jgi:hypothetical protein
MVKVTHHQRGAGCSTTPEILSVNQLKLRLFSTNGTRASGRSTEAAASLSITSGAVGAPSIVRHSDASKLAWVAHASRVLVKPFRVRELFLCFANGSATTQTHKKPSKVRFGEKPKPTRETRALPRIFVSRFLSWFLLGFQGAFGVLLVIVLQIFGVLFLHRARHRDPLRIRHFRIRIADACEIARARVYV